MRLLKINNTQVDIDELTAIGIDLQSYDIKEPGKTFIKVSNTFTIPKTVNNLAIFGLASDVQSTSTAIYSRSSVDYWIENEQLVKDARCRVDEIGERISLFIFDKPSIWDTLKTVYWGDFLSSFLTWMGTNYSLPLQGSPSTASASTFIGNYVNTTEGILLPYFHGNLGTYIHKGCRQIERLTIIGTTIGGAIPTLNWQIVSGIMATQNGSVLLTVGHNMTQVAAAVAANIAGNSTVTANYDVYSSGIYVFLAAKTVAVTDSTLNMSYTTVNATGITNNPTSGSFTNGVLPTGDFIEKALRPLTLYGFDGQIYLRQSYTEGSGIGGHFCIYIKTIFEYLEDTYGVNFGVSEVGLMGNIWDDTVVQEMFVAAPGIDVRIQTNPSNSHYFRIKQDGDEYLPYTGVKDKEDKTLYDFVQAFFQHFNAIIDYLPGDLIRIARFDDLETAGEVVDFSGRMAGGYSFKPLVENFVQDNYIKFKEIYEGGDSLLNSKLLQCLNENLDQSGDLFEIDAFVGEVESYSGYYILKLTSQEALKNFVFMVADGMTTKSIAVIYEVMDYTGIDFGSYSGVLKIAQLYDLNSEYNFLESIIEYPKFYEAKMWLTIEDIRDLQFFRQYFIKELNGSFFINKIKGFNPDKSNEPTTLELIRISDKTPDTLS